MSAQPNPDKIEAAGLKVRSAERRHVPELEQAACNQKPKTYDWRDLKLYRYEQTDLYQWFGKLHTSVFEDPCGEPFVLTPPPPPAETAGEVREALTKALRAIEFVHMVGRLSHTQHEGGSRDHEDLESDAEALNRLIAQAREINLMDMRKALIRAFSRAEALSAPPPAHGDLRGIDYTAVSLRDLSTSIERDLDADAPNYADWAIALPAGHWRAIRDALALLPQGQGWRDIASAPKDGTVIDVWRPEGGRDTVFWGYPHHECGEMGSLCDDDWHSIRAPGWVCNNFDEFLGRKHAPFTHWMPLPVPPSEGGAT